MTGVASRQSSVASFSCLQIAFYRFAMLIVGSVFDIFSLHIIDVSPSRNNSCVRSSRRRSRSTREQSTAA